MIPAVAALSLFQRDEPPALGVPLTDIDPAIRREIDYWRETLPTVESFEDLTGDSRLLDFVSTAFGFSEEDAPASSIYGLAFAEGAADPNSYANRWPDDRLRNVVRRFAFIEFGTARLSDRSFIDGIAKQYLDAVTARDARPAAAGITSQSIEATYFIENIVDVTSPADLVANDRLYRFALKAFELDDRINDRALIESVLIDGTGDETDLANQLGDPKLQALARAFGFGEVELFNVTHPAFGGAIARRVEALETPEAETVRGAERIDPETEYFQENIRTLQSVDDLINDRRLFAYVMTAYDLGDQTDRQGMIKRILEEGVQDDEALANRPSDPRYRQIARGLAIAEFGFDYLRNPDVVASIVSRYERVQREVEAGEENPVVELAAYFERKAPELTNWLFITADTRLRDVVFTALGLPQSLGALEPDKIVAALENRMDIADFQDPDKLDRFLKRYAAQAETAAGAANGFVRGAGAVTILGASTASNLYAQVSRL